MTKYCTLVGSRNVPDDIAKLQHKIGANVVERGYIIRSGNADGSDINFQRGGYEVDRGKVHVYLPWASFNSRFNVDGPMYYTLSEYEAEYAQQMLIRSKVMPYIRKVKDSSKKFHSRNFYQATGYNMQQSDVCISYAPTDKDGIETGGTRTAAQVSRYYGIPVYNLFIDEQREAVCKLLEIK